MPVRKARGNRENHVECCIEWLQRHRSSRLPRVGGPIACPWHRSQVPRSLPAATQQTRNRNTESPPPALARNAITERPSVQTQRSPRMRHTSTTEKNNCHTDTNFSLTNYWKDPWREPQLCLFLSKRETPNAPAALGEMHGSTPTATYMKHMDRGRNETAIRVRLR